MKHGLNARTGERCIGKWVTVTMGNRSTQAVVGCTCGLASYENTGIESALRDLMDEYQSLELDQPDVVDLEPVERDIDAEAEYFGQPAESQVDLMYALQHGYDEEPF